jgi:hypothetical protein
MTPSSLIRSLRTRGFRLAAAGGVLVVGPASALTPGERAAIRALLPSLVAALTPCRGPDDVHRLLESADAEVERLGVSGTRAEVAAAADRVSLAHFGGCEEAIRFAVADFLALVRSPAANGRSEAAFRLPSRCTAGTPEHRVACGGTGR